MTRHHLVTAFFIALLVFILTQVLWILSPFARPIFWAAILAFAFYPLHLKIKKAFKGHANTPAALTSLIVFATFVPLVVFLVAGLVTEVIRFSEWLQTAIREGQVEKMVNEWSALPWVQKMKGLAFRWDYVQENFSSWVGSGSRALADWAARETFKLTKSIVYAPIEFFFILFIVFFFLKDGPKIFQFIYDATPLEESDKKVIFKQINGTFEAVIRGQLLTALVQSGIGGIVYFLLGIPLPILFAAATFLTAMIPIFGAAAVWVPLTVFLLSQKLYAKALFLLFLGVFVISLADNILKPILIGKKTKLPYLLLLLGIIGGMEVYGLVGIFLAPAVLSLFFALITIYREKFL